MVKVDENYSITADNHCFILKQKYVIQDENSKNFGNVFHRDVGYYTSFAELIKGIRKLYLRDYLKKETEHTLDELLAECKRIDEFVMTIKM